MGLGPQIVPRLGGVTLGHCVDHGAGGGAEDLVTQVQHRSQQRKIVASFEAACPGPWAPPT